MTLTYSIIAPIYNEFDNLPVLYKRIKEVMDTTGEPWELVLIDDGSTDGSTDAIRSLAKQDERVRPVIFALARARGWSLRELTRSRHSLEDIYVQVTRPGEEEEG